MSTAAPTTVPPTTVAPTTAAPTTAVPTTSAPTTLAPTTVPPTTLAPEIILDVGENFFDFRDLPIIIGPIEFTGENLNTGIIVGHIEVSVVPTFSRIDIGATIDVDPGIEISIVPIFTQVLVTDTRCNFVKWSKIGYLNFEIDESNLAGERPLDWKGCIYHLGRLGDKVVAYGENGVTILKPSGVHYGMDTIYRVGLKNKGAFAGTDGRHFFVDNLSQLFQLDEKFVKLDYSEYLSQMGTIILSLDIEKNLLYICDGTYGFVYGVDSQSFGECPVNIAGIGVQSNLLYVVSDGAIVTPKFEICTDIYDLGTRNFKTIHEVEVGSNLTEFLYTAVDYRVSYKDDFRQIGWFLVNPDGRAFPKCYGSEFRFRVMSTIYEYFELDYLKVKGHIHGWQGFTYQGENLR